MQTKEIVTTSFIVAAIELLNAGKEGWIMDDANLPFVDHHGISHAWLVKEDSDEVAGLKADAFPASGAPKRGRPFKNTPAAQ